MKYFSIAVLFLLGFSAKAQFKEINPSIGWNFVKSQNLSLVDGVWYNTDFAAEKGYDYIFIMNHNLDSAMAFIQVFNLQEEFIGSKNRDTSMKTLELSFSVVESGVYKVYFGLNDKNRAVSTHNVQFILVRRKKV